MRRAETFWLTRKKIASGGIKRADSGGVHVVRKVEDNAIEIRPKNLKARLDLLRPELDTIHWARAREH